MGLYRRRWKDKSGKLHATKIWQMSFMVPGEGQKCGSTHTSNKRLAQKILDTRKAEIAEGRYANLLKSRVPSVKTSGQITFEHWRLLRDRGERVWLFRPCPSLLKHPAVRSYLTLNVPSGGCHRKRYKVRIRNTWYRTPLPTGIDGFVSGMTRLGPWICLKRMPRLSATNTLYVVRFLKRMDEDTKAAWALSFLTSKVQRALKAIRRIYPDRLVKYEPGNLMDLRVPIPQRTRGAKMKYLAATMAHISGNTRQCRKIADEWFRNTSVR